ncbi:MAG: hypothetical protein ABIB97_05490 [Patescibacteria group bacterium]
MIIQKKNSAGQGMIELVVSISIIVIGIVAVLSLSIVTITTARESLLSVEAANLAREGIEVVRNIRDTNWLKIQSGEEGIEWDTGLYDDTFPYEDVASAEFDPATGAWNLNFDIPDSRLKRLADGTYIYYGSPLEGPLSAFSRYIFLVPLCVDPGFGERLIPGGCGALKKIGIQVISDIRWRDRTKNRSVIVEEYLYNWRP